MSTQDGKEYKGEVHHSWKGGRIKTRGGYIWILNHDHPKTDRDGYVREANLICEKALGKNLPPKAVVHHIDHIKTNNYNQNLVICQNTGYNQILHHREKAYKACGFAHWRKCGYCHKWDDPKNLYISPNGYQAYHKSCAKEYLKKWEENKNVHN